MSSLTDVEPLSDVRTKAGGLFQHPAKQDIAFLGNRSNYLIRNCGQNKQVRCLYFSQEAWHRLEKLCPMRGWASPG